MKLIISIYFLTLIVLVAISNDNIHIGIYARDVTDENILLKEENADVLYCKEADTFKKCINCCKDYYQYQYVMHDDIEYCICAHTRTKWKSIPNLETLIYYGSDERRKKSIVDKDEDENICKQSHEYKNCMDCCLKTHRSFRFWQNKCICEREIVIKGD